MFTVARAVLATMGCTVRHELAERHGADWIGLRYSYVERIFAQLIKKLRESHSNCSKLRIRGDGPRTRKQLMHVNRLNNSRG